MDLVLERKHEQDDPPLIAPSGGAILITPPIDEDYWAYRVRLSDRQAIVGFPKFGTIGIGFAIEDADWNTNLPYVVATEEIFQHISHNKGDDAISDDDVREAIRLVQDAARADRND